MELGMWLVVCPLELDLLKAVFYIKTFKGTFLENMYQIVEDYESECYAQ